MIERKGISGIVYFIILIPLLIISFYVGGIFSFPDTTIINMNQKLTEVFQQFYKPWLWVNDKTPACLCVGLIAWVFLCSYIAYNYRNYHSGMEYGAEDWADPFDVTKRRSDPDLKRNRILSYNVKIAKEGPNAPSNNNMLVIGSSGTYKTTSIVTPNLLQAQDNFIVLDVKGEIMFKYGLYLKKHGYTLRCLNLKNQEQSDRYNPFEYIETEEDLIKLIANIQDSLTPPDSMKGDPFWDDGVELYLQSIFYYEWYMAKKENRTGTMNNILKLVNEESKPDKSVKAAKGEKPPTLLQKRMDALEQIDPNNPAPRDYRKLKEGASETVRSILLITNAKLKLCETNGVKRIFEDDDLNLREFGTGVGGTVEHPTSNKLALFLCVDDNDKSFNFICSMLYTQATTILCRMADNDFKDRGATLPIPLEMWMDEFYAGARPADTEALMGVIRSRNISMIPILQSIAQVKALFKTDKWEIIMDNCPTLVFLGSGAGAISTHKWISELLGKMTIDVATDGKSGQQYTGNNSRTGAELMTPAAVKRMSRKHCLIFTEQERPIYDYKAFPWEAKGASKKQLRKAEKKNIDITDKMSPYQLAMKLNNEAEGGGYVVREKCIVDPHTGAYTTISSEHPVEAVDKVPEGENVYNMNDEKFLYVNFKGKEPTQEEIDTEVKKQYDMQKRIAKMGEKNTHKNKENVTNFVTNNSSERVLPGSLADGLALYLDSLSDDERNLILEAIKHHIPEESICKMFCMSLEEMEEFYEAFFGA